MRRAPRRDARLLYRAALAGGLLEFPGAGLGATKMGGPGAPDDMDQAHLTQAWLAAGDDPKAEVTGQYFYHLKSMEPNPEAHDVALQDRLIAICSDVSGVVLPA